MNRQPLSRDSKHSHTPVALEIRAAAFLDEATVRRQALYEPDVAAYGRALTDGPGALAPRARKYLTHMPIYMKINI